MIGQVSGLHSLIGLPFLLASAPLTGMAAERMGSFVVPLLGLAAVQLVAALVLALLRVPDTEPTPMATVSETTPAASPA